MVVLSTHALDDPPATALEQAVANGLRDAGLTVVIVPHLYHLPEQSPLWQRIPNERPSEPLALLSWLHPRPAEWLLRRHGFRAEHLVAFDLRTFTTAETCVAVVRQALNTAATIVDTPATGRIVRLDESTTQRWHPIVDGARCVNCQHCLQFCLFGVYALDDAGRLHVRNPDQCKPGCPACSRICPKGAIIFPLYARDETIAGAPGRFMTPDLAARRMFYARTRQPCRVCANLIQDRQPLSATGGDLCPECGSPRTPATAAASPAPAAFDELDALVDQLDQVMQRKR